MQHAFVGRLERVLRPLFDLAAICVADTVTVGAATALKVNSAV